MKKIFILLSSIPLFLTSCSETTTNSKFRIYKDERYEFKTLTESKDSTKEIYYLVLNVKNDSDDTVTLNKTDFKLKFSEKTYDCLYFVNTYRSGATSINGVMTTYNYVETKSDTNDIKKAVANENGTTSMQNVYVAFDTKPDSSTSYQVLYKDTVLKTILDK